MNIDLNSDLGEAYGAWRMGDDAAMLAEVSSANIACGFHAGDPGVMLATVQQAAARNVTIGAHISYPDRVGFGRRFMDMSAVELMADVIYQIGALQAMARVAGARVAYVKPHGALYNAIAQHQAQGDAVIAGILAVDPALYVMGLAGSPFLDRAQDAGLNAVGEVFADRAYMPDGALMPRSMAGAVLHDAAKAAARMVRFVQEGVIAAADGTLLRLNARSICVHGDTPDALVLTRALRAALLGAGVAIAPFAVAG